MKFRVLGCSGSESSREHPCSFLIDTHTLVDMGSAASRLTLEEQKNITDIFIGHGHLDHTKDLAFYAENIFEFSKNPTVVHSTHQTLTKLKNHLMNNELWPDFTSLPSARNSVLAFKPFETHVPFRVGEMQVLALPVNHPGGCVSLFFESALGVLLYTGDTGATEEVWKEANRKKSKMKAILLETSFPNRLQGVADVSGHHTPQTLAAEIQKIQATAPIYIYHLKVPYRDETLRELEKIEDSRIRILEPGMVLDF